MQKTFGNVFFGYRGGLVFHVFPRFHSIMSWGGGGERGCPLPQYLLELLWMLQYSIIVDCCYVELCIICNRTPRSDIEMNKVQSQQKPLEQYVRYIQHCIFKVNNKDTSLILVLLTLNMSCPLFY